MAHSVHDSAARERQSFFGQIEQHRDITRVGLEAAQKTSSFINETNIDDLEKQSGTRLSITKFEDRVQKICPSVIFRTNFLTEGQAKFLHLNSGATTRRMIQVLPDGSLKDLAGFQNQALLPEYTLVLTRLKRVPRQVEQHKLLRAADGTWVKVPKIDGRDIPNAKESKTNDGVRHFEFDRKGETPGETYIKEPAGTLVGWRTLLARLVGYKLVTPEDVEREFGRSPRASWAVRMGRRDVSLQF